MNNILFRENQRLRQWWIFAIVGLIVAVAWWTFVQQILLGKPFGSNPWSDLMVWIIFALCGVGLPLLMFFATLQVTVKAGGLRIHFAPFRNRWIEAAEIESWEAVTYQPMRHWGGWGIRCRWGGGWAYTVHGDRGVQLELADDKKLLVGSQRPDELAAALTAMAEGKGDASQQ